MGNEIKAIFFDLDGTLLAPKTKSYHEDVRNAFHTLKEQGVKLFVATGRSVTEILPTRVVEGLDFDGFVTLNGQFCFNEHQVIYHNPIPAEDITRIVAQLDKHPYPCLFVESDRIYINVVNEMVSAALGEVGMKPPQVVDIHRALEHPIYQLVVFIDDEAEQYPFQVLRHCKSTRWSRHGLDIIPANGSKAAGIAQMLAHYNLQQENTMAFGDGENDVEMLRYAAVGVAMGNACASAKDAADYVTRHADEDGILHALRHFGVL